MSENGIWRWIFRWMAAFPLPTLCSFALLKIWEWGWHTFCSFENVYSRLPHHHYSSPAGEPAGLFTTPPPDKISKIYAHIHFVEGEGNAYFITFFDNVNLILSKIYHFSQYYSSVTMLVWVLRLCIITRIMRLPYRRTNFFGWKKKNINSYVVKWA